MRVFLLKIPSLFRNVYRYRLRIGKDSGEWVVFRCRFPQNPGGCDRRLNCKPFTFVTSGEMSHLFSLRRRIQFLEVFFDMSI
jgi:hypothetical protein